MDGSGVVTGVAAGTVTIKAKKDSIEGSVSVTVNAVEITEFVVFDDDFKNGEAFMPFEGKAYWASAQSKDTTEHHSGTASFKVDMSVSTDGWLGGAFKSAAKHDLSAFKALTFWAKASKATSLNVFGIGNNGDDSSLMVERPAIALTTDWQQFTIPMPVSAKFSDTDAMFHFADDVDGGYTLWLDDVKFEKNADVGTSVAVMATESKSLEVGQTTKLNGRGINYTIGTETFHVDASAFFTYASSDTAIATVDEAGVVTAVAAGSATITAKFGTEDVAGALSLTVTPPPAVTAPPAPAAAPSEAMSNVYSLFTSSGAYAPQTVDEWNPGWGQSTVLSDYTFSGGSSLCKKYESLNYSGITMYSTPIDATTYTHFSMDVWSANATVFKMKIVSFATTAHGQVEAEVALDNASTPKFEQSKWVHLDVPLTAFSAVNAGMAFDNIQQLVISAAPSGTSTVFVDNIYFHK